MHIEEKDGNLVIVDFSDLEAYKIARKIESDGTHFYERLMGELDDPREKEAVKLLVDAERDHLRYFEGELSILREREEDSFEEDDLLSGLDYGIFQPYQSMDDLSSNLTTFNKAIRLGIVVENKSIQFYEHCRDHVSSPEAKKELDRIIEEERRHKRLLEKMLKEE